MNADRRLPAGEEADSSRARRRRRACAAPPTRAPTRASAPGARPARSAKGLPGSRRARRRAGRRAAPRAPRSRGCGGRGAGRRRRLAQLQRPLDRVRPVDGVDEPDPPWAASACDVRVAASSTIQPNPCVAELVAERGIHRGTSPAGCGLTLARMNNGIDLGSESAWPATISDKNGWSAASNSSVQGSGGTGRDSRACTGLAARCLHDGRR